MADEPKNEDRPNAIGPIESVKALREAIAESVEKAIAPLMRDGTLAAAWRQGADEIGQALKAFPESISAHHEPGTINNPLYLDIAKARESYTPSPSELIDRQRTNEPEQDQGQDHHRGHHRGHSR